MCRVREVEKDLAARLAHKKPYLHIEREPDQQLDLLIVVEQMLTGFDSKWLNTLYLDKVLKYQQLDTLINQQQTQLSKLKNIKQACLEKMFA